MLMSLIFYDVQLYHNIYLKNVLFFLFHCCFVLIATTKFDETSGSTPELQPY